MEGKKFSKCLQNDSSFYWKLLYVPKTHAVFHRPRFLFPSFFPHAVQTQRGSVLACGINTWWINIVLQFQSTSKKKFSLLLKLSLTSDVLHGDGAGGGEFPRHSEGFVTQLLVHQCTYGEQTHKEKIQHSDRFQSAPLRRVDTSFDRITSFIGRLQQQVDRIQGEDGDGHEENPVNRGEGSLAEC